MRNIINALIALVSHRGAYFISGLVKGELIREGGA